VSNLEQRFDDEAGKGGGRRDETDACLPFQRRSGLDGWIQRERTPLDEDCRAMVSGSRKSSSDAPLTSMMEAAEPGQSDDLGTFAGLRLDEPAGGRLFPKAVMGPVLVVIGEVFLEDALQMPLIQDDHVINGKA